MSIYETILDIWSDADLLTLLEIDAAMDSSPNVEKNIVINEHPYISQSFSTKIIDEKIPRTEISARHKKQQ